MENQQTISTHQDPPEQEEQQTASEGESSIAPKRRNRGRRGGSKKKLRHLLAGFRHLTKHAVAEPSSAEAEITFIQEIPETQSEEGEAEEAAGDGEQRISNKEELLTYFTSLPLGVASRLTVIEGLMLNRHYELALQLLLAWEEQTYGLPCRYLSLYLLLFLERYEDIKTLLSSLPRQKKKQALVLLALLLLKDQGQHLQQVQTHFAASETWEQGIVGIYQRCKEFSELADLLLAERYMGTIVDTTDFLAHTVILWHMPQLIDLFLPIIPKHKREILQQLPTLFCKTDWTELLQSAEPVRKKTIRLLLGLFAHENKVLQAAGEQWELPYEKAEEYTIPDHFLRLLAEVPHVYFLLRLLCISLCSPLFLQIEQFHTNTQDQLHTADQAETGPILTPVFVLSKDPLQELQALLSQPSLSSEDIIKAQGLMKKLPDEQEQFPTALQIGERLVQSQQWTLARQYFRQLISSHSHTDIQAQLRTIWDLAKHKLNIITNLTERKKGLEGFFDFLISLQQWEYIEHSALEISSIEKREKILLRAKDFFIEHKQWPYALRCIQKMHDVVHRDRLIRIFSNRLALEQQWDLAEQGIEMIRDRRQKTRAIQKLGQELSLAHEESRLISLIKQAWGRAETREEALELFLSIQGLLAAHQELIPDLLQAFGWTEAFLER